MLGLKTSSGCAILQMGHKRIYKYALQKKRLIKTKTKQSLRVTCMTFLDFAKKVLHETNSTLSPREIWNSPSGEALQGQFKSVGKTPVLTLGAALSRACKKKDSPFIAVGDHPVRYTLKNRPIAKKS